MLHYFQRCFGAKQLGLIQTEFYLTFVCSSGKKMNGHTMLVFIPPHDNVHRLQVTSATLWLQIRYHNLGRNFHHLLKEHSITLYIFRVENQLINYSNSSTIHKGELNEELILSHKIKITRQGWKHIDLKDAVQKWFTESNNRKLTLLVDCVGCDSVIDIVLFEDTKHEDVKRHENMNAHDEHNKRHVMKRHKKENYRPFIVIMTKPKSVRRTRRHALTCDTFTSQCCKQSLFVSFKELGWDDWIIAPRGYYANYCVGDCSKRRTPDTYVNFHSHVIEEYRNKNPYASITPCCAPIKLSSISLIYFDPDLNIIKADLPKMVVDECGCT